MHRFHNIPDSLRERSIPLKDVLQFMKLTKDDVVIDVGAGNGYYAFAFAKICKKVYAVDQGYTDETMNSLAEKASESGLNNLQVVKRNVCDGLQIKDYTHAFFSNSFHDINCQDQLLKEIASQGAKLTIIEFKPSTPFGPPPFRRISEDKLVNLLSQYGYHARDKKEFEFHYLLTCSPRRGDGGSTFTSPTPSPLAARERFARPPLSRSFPPRTLPRGISARLARISLCARLGHALTRSAWGRPRRHSKPVIVVLPWEYPARLLRLIRRTFHGKITKRTYILLTIHPLPEGLSR